MNPFYTQPDVLEQVNDAVAYIRRETKMVPEVGIILGTGLGGLVKEVRNRLELKYEDIPHFPVSTVESHTGKLIFGKLGNKNVVVMQGRFHSYEGYTLQQVVFPVRVMSKRIGLGAKTLLISNAAGGMNPNFRRGDIMFLTDHINLLGDNPLIGPNREELGQRFPDMSEAYDKALLAKAEQIALDLQLRVHRGVMIAMKGPSLETRAEYRFLRSIGGDTVGMSTIPENIAAVHLGMKVFAASIVTDECFPDSLKPLDLKEVIAAANEAEPKLTKIFTELVKRI
ncbi:MAG TPA: purine-nucleoside phosphorylase [Bacteroidota bacterium]|nr:purine-nucleoside phosphorylase [Bacteroidota bacterium]